MADPGSPRPGGARTQRGRTVTHCYRPQRSWGKVMFLQASVVLLTGGVSASVHAGIPSPQGAAPLSRHPPGADNPQEQDPPGADTSGADTPRADTPPPPPGGDNSLGADTPCGTHPTGMQSCLVNFSRKLHENETDWAGNPFLEPKPPKSTSAYCTTKFKANGQNQNKKIGFEVTPILFDTAFVLSWVFAFYRPQQ